MRAHWHLQIKVQAGRLQNVNTGYLWMVRLRAI